MKISDIYVSMINSLRVSTENVFDNATDIISC